MSSGLRLFAVAAIASSACHLAWAADLAVPADYPTIQSAIDASAAGDIVIVAAGTYAELIRLNGKSITLRSADGAAKTIIDAENLGTAVKFVNGETPATVLEGFTIRNGRAAVGGGIYINSASPTIRNCILAENQASSRGGGLAAVNSSPSIVECEFVSNVADARGGGAYLFSDSDVVFSDCSFTTNRANNRSGESLGGAVAAEVGSDSSCLRCVFTGNVAQPPAGFNGISRGGAIWSLDSTLTLSDTAFSSNRAGASPSSFEAFGGAVWSSALTPVVRCTFTENESNGTGGGGAISCASTVDVEDSSFSQNRHIGGGQGGAIRTNSSCSVSATNFTDNWIFNPSSGGSSGGAVYSGALLTISGGAFQGNYTRIQNSGAFSDGGAASAESIAATKAEFIGNGAGPGVQTRIGGGLFASSTITAMNCLFRDNRCGLNGGALSAGGMLQATGCTFESNEAPFYGGAAHSNSAVALSGCSATGNSAEYGGAFSSDGLASATASIFRDNTARYDGGAIRCSRTGEITDCTFENNVLTGGGSDVRGGAIACVGGASFVSGPFSGCTFRGNRAENASRPSGGAVYAGRVGSISNCVFEANLARGTNGQQARGGALCLGSATISGSQFRSNQADAPGGNTDGGAIEFDRNLGTGEIQLMNCTFSYNAATGTSGEGGGVHTNGDPMTAADCLMTGNSGTSGGAMHIASTNLSNVQTITRTTFEKNFATNGAGVYFTSNTATPTQVEGCQFNMNLAFSNGAGIYFSGAVSPGLPTWSDSSFFGNIAGNGGGVYLNLFGSTRLQFDRLVFASNVGSPAGAGYAGSPGVEYRNSTFCGNDTVDLEGNWTDGGGNVFGSGLDCNANGACDGADIGSGASSDCNANGVPDECDLGDGTSGDVNANGIPDECEADCDSDGLPDRFAIKTGAAVDCNANGLPDACDVASGASDDLNGDGVPDECQPDCNGNGAPDDYDLSTGTSSDCDGNLMPDECDILDGVPDCNGNGVPDSCDIDTGSSSDIDQDGTPDECQPDCNANGVPDAFEIASGSAADCDANGTPDSCDIASGAADVDGNGVPDICEADCNGNGLPDAYEIATELVGDCDANAVPDSCDIAAGAADQNLDGVPDSCQCIADLNGDGSVGGADLSILLSFWGPLGTFPAADLNGDDTIGGADLAILLSQWGPCN